MALDRRSLLKLGGAAALVLTAGGGAFLMTRSPSRALAPWQAAGNGYADPRLKALSYAILAPNPHNRQPWLIDLREDGELTLFCHPDRVLPETDPFQRQIVIGLGCFLELLAQAAAEQGIGAEVLPFPEGQPEPNLDTRPIARVRFHKAGGKSDPLFRQVLARRSNKEPYDTTRPVADRALGQLAAAAGGTGVVVQTTNEKRPVAELRELTWQAMKIEIETPRTYLESVRLMRLGKAEIEANPDGIDLGGPFLETLNKLGLMTRQSLADPQSTAFQQGLDMYREITGTAMAYVWLKTSGNGRLDQLAAGRAWLRLNLKATELGLGLHPLSQALQEYPEMEPHYARIHEQLAGPGQRLQMFGRLGYGPEVAPSPRWPLESKLQKA
jgi:hypothetical protein